MHPLREARLHYVEPALEALAASGGAARVAADGRPLRALDVGFGRGMNTAALVAACGDRALEVLGLEPHPEALEPWPRRPPRGADFPWWGRGVGNWRPGPRARVEVRAEAAPAGLRADDGPFDLVLLDLYSPGALPEPWQAVLDARLAAACRPGAALATYSCARAVRDALAASGWEPRVLRREGVRDTLVATLHGGQQR